MHFLEANIKPDLKITPDFDKQGSKAGLFWFVQLSVGAGIFTKRKIRPCATKYLTKVGKCSDFFVLTLYLYLSFPKSIVLKMYLGRIRFSLLVKSLQNFTCVFSNKSNWRGGER